eukprot:GHVO01041146.1.p1 GENE.GHVO01041146.1~~GHVO01041146.1.p1  ORF type:complete len:607 (+),score=102.25 GHVO01041146.1:66-1823(+)
MEISPTNSERRCRKSSLHRPSHHPNPNISRDAPSILFNPHFNKGTAFSVEERKILNLRGLLPTQIETIDVQAKRCLAQFRRFTVPMSKYLYLTALRERNETLYFRLLIENLAEMLPIVYTPTVGQACIEFAHEIRQAEGMYIGAGDRGHVRSILDNWSPNLLDEVSIIVVTDGSRILGLGDLGANGMGIPIGKISLYVACGGFHPAAALPVVIDAGTNNKTLLADEFYVGEHHERLDDSSFYGLMEEFLLSVKDRWPRALVQFEDFSNNHCFQLLDMWRPRMLCFNDDIQGTGAVIGAGFVNAVRAAKINAAELRVVVLGCGAAGNGVAFQICSALGRRYGLSAEETKKFFYMVDSRGLVTTHRGDTLPDFKLAFARDDITEKYTEFKDVLKNIKPHALIGLSGQGGSFDEEVLTLMSEWNHRPIVFPLSNPTSKSECTAEAAFNHSGGRVLFASGSPYDPVEVAGVTHYPSQGNNLYTFPGIGFGAWLCGAKVVSDDMLTAATLKLADLTPEDLLEKGQLYPDLTDIRNTSAKIATEVIKRAIEEGHVRETNIPEDIEKWVRDSMYFPDYLDWEPEPSTPSTTA